MYVQLQLLCCLQRKTIIFIIMLTSIADSNPTARAKFFVLFAKKHGMDPFTPEHWYKQSRKHIMSAKVLFLFTLFFFPLLLLISLSTYIHTLLGGRSCHTSSQEQLSYSLNGPPPKYWIRQVCPSAYHGYFAYLAIPLFVLTLFFPLLFFFNLSLPPSLFQQASLSPNQQQEESSLKTWLINMALSHSIPKYGISLGKRFSLQRFVSSSLSSQIGIS